jgi:hypothetical protein
MMMGVERTMVGVSDGSRDFGQMSKMVVSSGCWSGIVS